MFCHQDHVLFSKICERGFIVVYMCQTSVSKEKLRKLLDQNKAFFAAFTTPSAVLKKTTNNHGKYKWTEGDLRFYFKFNTKMHKSNKSVVSPHISRGCVVVCLTQFVSQPGPLVYRTPFLICSSPPNASD